MTGLPVITLCKVVPATGSYLAIDLMPSFFEAMNEKLVLPRDSSYYLVDNNGSLLYYQSCWNYQQEDFQELVNSYLEGAERSGNDLSLIHI